MLLFHCIVTLYYSDVNEQRERLQSISFIFHPNYTLVISEEASNCEISETMIFCRVAVFISS